jgi:hypothetical protein|tara:strand:- start:613 stop:951 length:339 start_codon:yes stop_codon:yes gene_type:complete
MENNQKLDLTKFAEDLVKSAGFDSLEENFQNDMKEQVVGEATNRIGMMIIGDMTEEELREYDEILGKNKNNANSEDVQKFVQKTIPDLPQKILITLKTYRDEFISTAKAVKK